MKGECLCSSVTIETADVHEFEACHCSMCRRWGGGAFLGVHCDSNVSVSGTEFVTVFESSDWAERGFCSKCGTHLYYHLKPTDEYVVPVGLFQQENSFEFTQQIFVDHKPGYYAFANQTEELTEQQVFDKFGA